MKLSTSQLIVGGYSLALLVLGIVALLAFTSTREYVASVTARRQISNRTEGLEVFLSLLKDAETGQRGYLLTNKQEYLPPYSIAVATWQTEFAALRKAFGSAGQEEQKLLDRLQTSSRAKMAELEQTIQLRRNGRPEDEQKLQEILASGAGRELMEDIREVAQELKQPQRAAFEEVNARANRIAGRTTTAVGVLSPLAVALVVGAIMLVQRDLRRRTLAEDALREQRALLSAILSSMNEGVVVANDRGEIVLFNPAAERMLGRGATDKHSDEWTDFYAVNYPDKVTPVKPNDLPLVRAIRGETVEQFEMYIQPPNGVPGRFLMATAGPMVDELGHRGGVVILRDVTASRAEERRFQSLLESAPDGLIIVNRQGIIELVNSQAERLFGYDRQRLVGQPVELLVPTSQRAGHPAQRDAFFHNPRLRGMGSGLELSGQRADGSLFPVEISLSPVEGGSQPVVCAAIRDVTQRRLVMEQIRQLNSELEDRVEARTAELATANQELLLRSQENELFVYSVSHDLRSPLVNLQGFSQELDSACAQLEQLAKEAAVADDIRSSFHKIIDGDIKESIHFIRTSVSRLSGIINALLRLSRAGRVVYQWQSVDVNRIVRRVLDTANRTILDRQAEVVVNELPRASGDSTALDQLFANLIQNALHYLDGQRAGRVEVGVVTDPASNGLATYFVRDNGVGIPTAQQAKVFQAFQRLNPELAPGEGMGLTLVQRIVERHGGRIWVESQPGEGSTFYFTLPTITDGESHDGKSPPA